MTFDLLISCLIGYLFGSVPFGLLLTKFAGFGDVRAIGSGNIGATNVLRTGHKGLAALTLLADMAKGLVPVLIVSHLFGFDPYAVMAGVAALLGHMFPVWLKFKGGKGVATYIGVCFGIGLPLGLSFIALWLGTAFLFRYSSLSALVAVSVLPLIALLLYAPLIALSLLGMSVLVVVRHKENIGRLLRGGEDKIGQKQTD